METLLTKHIYFITCIRSQIVPTNCQLAQMDNSPQAAFVDTVTTVPLHPLPNLQNVIFLPRSLAQTGQEFPLSFYLLLNLLASGTAVHFFMSQSLPSHSAKLTLKGPLSLRVPRTEVSKEKGRGTARPGCCLLLPHIQTVYLHFTTNYLFRDVLMMSKGNSHACTSQQYCLH